MLVLSRQVNEVIMIGRDIEVMVVSIIRDKVKLGITAPKDIRVDRMEVRDRINGKPPTQLGEESND